MSLSGWSRCRGFLHGTGATRTPLELRSLGRCLKGVSVLSADSRTQAVGPRSPHSTARGPARPRRGLPAVPTWSLRRSPGFCSFSERSSPSGSVSKSQGAGRNFGLWSCRGLGTSEPEGEMKSHLWSVILLFIYLFIFLFPLGPKWGKQGAGARMDEGARGEVPGAHGGVSAEHLSAQPGTALSPMWPFHVWDSECGWPCPCGE